MSSSAMVASSANLTSTEFLCDPLPEWGLGVGVAMGVAGSIGINVGQNIQAMGIKTLDPSEYSAPWRSKLWRIGLCIFIVFALINFAALSLAPASILCPIESLQFVTNVVWNSVVNGIRVGFRMQLGVLLALVGTVLTVTFGAPGDCHSPAQMRQYWTSFTWWLYLAITLSVAAASFSAHRFYRQRWKATGEVPPHRALLPVCYSLYCSLIGGAQLIVHSKMISVLLSVVTEDPLAVFTSWLLYVELFLVLLCGITWGIKLTECLALYDPLVIIPLMVGTYITFGGIAGGIFFQEFAQLHTATQAGYGGWVLYVGGMLMVLVGLWLIADASINPGPVSPDDDGDVPSKPTGPAVEEAGEGAAGFMSLREDEAWPARPADSIFEGEGEGNLTGKGADGRPAGLSRALSTGGLDLPRLHTDRSGVERCSAPEAAAVAQLTSDRERQRTDTLDSGSTDTSRSRRGRISREHVIKELLFTQAPSLLPSPFAVYGMAPGGSRPGSREASSGGVQRASTWTNFGNFVPTSARTMPIGGPAEAPAASGGCDSDSASVCSSSRGSSQPTSNVPTPGGGGKPLGGPGSQPRELRSVPELPSALSHVTEIEHEIEESCVTRLAGADGEAAVANGESGAPPVAADLVEELDDLSLSPDGAAKEAHTT